MTNTENLYERIAEQEGWEYSTCFGQFHRSVPKDGYNQIESCFPDAMCFRLIEKYDLDVAKYNGERIVMRWDEKAFTAINIWHKNLEDAVMLAALSISEGE